MPKKIQNTTKAHIISVPLPNQTESYTVISHQFVIDHAYLALANAGFTIVEEEYRCTADGNIAQGIYKLHYKTDSELSMMFAWTNSYNKQVKFKCGIGAYINNTDTVMTSADIGTWTRKHTGTADTETIETIDEQVKNAYMYYDQLVSDKVVMESIIMNKRRQAQMLGILFAEYNILTTEQASIVRAEMNRPSNTYKNAESLWAFYCYVTIALQSSHPKTWMEDQRILHYFISSVGNFTPVPVVVSEVEEEIIVDPLENNYGQPENQTNLLHQIAEVTGDESVLEPKLPVEPADYDFTQTMDYSNAVYPRTEEQSFQLPDNQVVQEEVEIESVLHQSEEIILDANEAEEDYVIVENEIWTTEEEPQKIATIIDEEIVYTDVVGNTFEVPIVPCVGHNTETEKEIFDLDFIEENNEEENIPDFF